MTSGFVLVDKPAAWTSHDVVARVRKLAGIKKVGHAGTLDPLATGLLVLGVGKATRLLRFVQDLPKEYVARVLLGVATDSLDADGAVLSREPMPVTQQEVEAVLDRFRGDIHQIPPMVSARKVGGRKLYEMAREGIEIEREARQVTIHSLDIIDFAPSDYPEVVIRVRCSKGTYVRTLANDIAQALGGHGHLTALRRTANGSLLARDSHSMESIEDAVASQRFEDLVLSPADALADFPSFIVTDAVAAGIANGVAVASMGDDVPIEGFVRVLREDGSLAAIYRQEAARVVPEVVLS